MFQCSNPERTDFDKYTNNSQVDVSETFNDDELWFRNVSVLIQRSSLPENL